MSNEDKKIVIKYVRLAMAAVAVAIVLNIFSAWAGYAWRADVREHLDKLEQQMEQHHGSP